MTKDLKSKAVDIKGKKYVLVSDRVLYFNDTYANGCIKTEKLVTDNERVEFKAIVIPDIDKPERYFSGHSQAVWGDGYINKTSALENAETSAVGRALALMGIGVIDSIASVDEINKAKEPKTPDRNYPIFKTKTYKPKEDPQKVKIKALLDEPDPTKLQTKDDYEIECYRRTKLHLIPANYDSIIDKLIDEVNSAEAGYSQAIKEEFLNSRD